jgi:hypothetical protein
LRIQGEKRKGDGCFFKEHCHNAAALASGSGQMAMGGKKSRRRCADETPSPVSSSVRFPAI